MLLHIVKRIFFTLLFITNSLHLIAAVYQWSVPIKGNDKYARAFLWVPENCKYLRGIVLANQVILEKRVCDNSVIRAACSRQDLGIVVMFRSGLAMSDFAPGKDDIKLQQILNDLANMSGYGELAKVPILPIGHSGGAIGTWDLAYSNPEKVFGLITLHAAASVNPPVAYPKRTPSGIPVLAVSGEYESWGDPSVPLDQHWRWLRADLLDIRAKYKSAFVCEVVQPGAGHFNFDDHLASLTALFIEKAAQYRIPTKPKGDTNLTVLNTLNEANGWLTAINPLEPDRFSPVQSSDFKGDRTMTFWNMDEEMAKAVDSFASLYGGKTDQRVTFKNHKDTIPAGWIINIPFEPLADGESFKVNGCFLNETPGGVANAGRPLGNDKGTFSFSLIGGWGGGGAQIDNNTFQICYDNFGISHYTSNIMVMVSQAGSQTYKYAEQAGQIQFPEKLTDGLPQAINFKTISNVNYKVNNIFLDAKSTEGLPVSFYVQSGPAIVKNNQLIIMPIPPRAKLPIEVTIVAYQYGRSVVPKVQTALPAIQSFFIEN